MSAPAPMPCNGWERCWCVLVFGAALRIGWIGASSRSRRSWLQAWASCREMHVWDVEQIMAGLKGGSRAARREKRLQEVYSCMSST